jgi:hypothetical protein
VSSCRSSIEAGRSTQGGSRTHNRPGLSRAARPVGVPGRSSGAAGRSRRCAEAEAVGLEPTSGLRRHLFSRQAPHPAGWLPFRSGGWNRTSGLHVQSVASLPAATAPELSNPTIREGGFEPPPPDSKSGGLPFSRFPRASCGSRTRLSGVGSPCLADRPRTRDPFRGFRVFERGLLRHTSGRRASAGSGTRTPVAWLEARHRTTGPIPLNSFGDE